MSDTDPRKGIEGVGGRYLLHTHSLIPLPLPPTSQCLACWRREAGCRTRETSWNSDYFRLTTLVHLTGLARGAHAEGEDDRERGSDRQRKMKDQEIVEKRGGEK